MFGAFVVNTGTCFVGKIVVGKSLVVVVNEIEAKKLVV